MTAYPNVRGFFDPATATWTYVLWAGGDKNCAIIDSVLDYDAAAGRTATTSADKVAYFVQSQGLTVQWILETHIHADHLTAAQHLKKKLGGKIGVSRHILEVAKTWQPLFALPMDGAQFDHLFNDDEEFAIGALKARIIHVPGHTPADTAYLISDDASGAPPLCVFVGDAMFLPDVGTGRCDFPGGSAAASYDSTRRLLALPDATRMYVGHDYPAGKGRGPQCLATVAEQKAANILANARIAKDAFVQKRNASDEGKHVPELLLPSVQVNLRAGETTDHIKIPLNAI